MKITAHACLETMMAKALRDLESAYQELLKAKINMLTNPCIDSRNLYGEAQAVVENASTRYSELITARKIIKKMEAKGVEI